MNNYFEFVKTAETQLLAEGYPLSGDIGDAAKSDEQKGILCCRTAWLIYQTDKSVGLLEKSGGANYRGLSADRLCDRYTGDLVDMASTRDDPAAGKFFVTTGWNPDDAPVDPARWREPTRDLANLPETGGGGGIVGGGAIDEQLDQIIALLQSAADVETRNTAAILERDDANTERILGRLDQIVAGFNEAVQKMLVLMLAQNTDGTVPPENKLLLLILKLLAGDGTAPE